MQSKNIFKRIIHSIYFRFILIFFLVILFSSSLSVIYSLSVNLPDTKDFAKEQLVNKMGTIRTLIEKNKLSFEDALSIVDEANYAKYLDLQDIVDNEPFEINNEVSTLLYKNEVVCFMNSTPMKQEYACIARIDGVFLVLYPSVRGSQIRVFEDVLKGSVMSFMILSIVLMILALSLVMNPIKKLSKALSGVAKGNYDTLLEIHGENEMYSLYENFNQMAKQLKSNEYLNKTFVANISHEFKTPITSIKGYAKLIESGNLTDEELKEYSKIIVSESERLSHMSSSLLKISQLDSAVIINKNDKFRVDEQIRKSLVLMQKDWENKNLDINLELEELEILGAEELTYQVWINLVSNAIKFSNENGKIDITLKKADKIVFTITDNGQGIADEEKENIFKHFFVSSNNKNSSSTGLGLSITKKILERLGGSISFESQLGKGSTFTVIL